MQRIIFTEEFCQPQKLFPFTLTRQVQDIRIGILTIREKWEKMLQLPSLDKWMDDYKDGSKSVKIDEQLGEGSNLLVHANILPSNLIIEKIKHLQNGDLLYHAEKGPIACKFSNNEILQQQNIKVKRNILYTGDIISIHLPWHIFQLNDIALKNDFELITNGRKSAKISSTNKIINEESIFLEEGAIVEHSLLNATNGPIYIANNAEVMEGCLIRGAFALCEGAVLKMGTKIYGATTLGPNCIGGGEIKNSVLFGNSNKAHDGYLGDSVLGEWCNLGAGSSNSNIKNTASPVKVYNAESNDMHDAGLKCGLLMGDYSRAAINTMFNTGTVVGICVNVFGDGLTPKFIPNFSWGAEGVKRYEFNKALIDIESWKQLKKQLIYDEEKTILKYIYEKL